MVKTDSKTVTKFLLKLNKLKKYERQYFINLPHLEALFSDSSLNRN